MSDQPQVRTGATATPQGNYYAQGISNPANGGQVTDINNPEPNDAPSVPMFAPDGKSGDIPATNVQAAIKAGFKPAYEMTAPDGKTTGYIPQDKLLDAQNAGFKLSGKLAGVRVAGVNASGQPILAPDQQPSDAKLYGEALFNPVGSGAHPQGILGGIEQVGGRALQAIAAPFIHPLSTLKGAWDGAVELSPFGTAMQPEGGPIANRIQQFGQDWKKSPSLALENAAGDAVGAVEGGRMAGAGSQAVIKAALPVAGRILLLGKTPEEAYESALKPSTTMNSADRANIVQTGLENAVPISKSGVEKIGDLIDNLNQQIKDQIASDPHRPIDPNAVAGRANQVIPRFANQVNANEDLAAIQASKDQFLHEQGAKPGTPAIPPQPNGLYDAQGNPIMNAGTPAQPPKPAPPMDAAKAQAMKQGTYRVLSRKFGEQGSASVEAQKALARGLKEEISNQFPEINNLNAQESKLLDLQPVLERAVNRISNHQLIGIGTPIAGAAARTVTGSGTIGIAASALKAALDNPMVKSRLAIAVSKGSRIPYGQAAARVAAYSASLGSYARSSANNAPAYSSAP